MKKQYIIAIGIIAFFTSIIITINMVKESKLQNTEKETKISENIEDECTKEYSKETKIEAVVATKEKISANSQLILKKYFKQCDHTINEYVELPKELVNMTKEEVQKHYPDWEVIGFEKEKVILYKEFDGVCGEHFKLRVENGKVVVYIVDTDGKESLYEKTNISSEYLTETDLINMQDGLEIYGKEELNQIIEDFE